MTNDLQRKTTTVDDNNDKNNKDNNKSNNNNDKKDNACCSSLLVFILYLLLPPKLKCYGKIDTLIPKITLKVFYDFYLMLYTLLIFSNAIAKN